MNASIVIVFLLTIFIKSYAYYRFKGTGRDKIAFTVMTTLGISFLFVLAWLARGIVAPILFLVIYTAISLIMLVDVVYYKQFNMFTSVNLFGMMGKLSEVGSSVKQILDYRFLIFMLDMPIVFYVILKIPGLWSVDLYDMVSGMLLIIIMVPALVIPTVGKHMIGEGSPFYRIANSEFFNYHIRDIYVNWINKPENVFFDEELRDESKVDGSGNDEYFGICKGKNLVVLQLEAFQEFVVNRFYDDQELTPFINSLIEENGLYFENYYHQVGYGNTADAEFVSNNSLYGTLKGATYDLYGDSKFQGLPWQLRHEGYSTKSFHGFKGEYWNRKKAHISQGFEEFIAKEELGEGNNMGMGIADDDFYKKVVGYVKDMKKPFYSFIISLSMHHPYKIPDEMAKINLKNEDKGTLLGNYLQMARYIDDCVKTLFDEMKEKGLYEDTVFAIYGDHQGISLNDKDEYAGMSRLLGYDYDVDEMAHIPLIIHSKSIKESKSFSVTGGQIDFMPTIMNILGVENKNPYIFGQNLTKAETGFVPMHMYTGAGSFIKDDTVFIVEADGLFENARAYSRETLEELEIEEYREDFNNALLAYKKSDYIKDNNVIEKNL